MKSVINLKSEVYYNGTYWNDYQSVVEYMCKNFTGDKKVWWVEDFKARYAKRPFKSALSLNCGDGRWEREFIDKKIATKITAFDISPELISTASRLKGKRNIDFFVGDANKVNFKKNDFDLIINYAALHHTQFINRMSRILANALKPDGVFVNFEYIGPQRNQYPLFQWLIAKFVNQFLPKEARQKLGYPHLPTMLVTDPTEAIHSDLIIQSLEKYFEIIQKKDTNGGIAYLLLTHNHNMRKLSKRKAEKNINNILKLDKIVSKAGVIPNLFSYFIAKPKKSALKNKAKLRDYQMEENYREKLAENRRGVYSSLDYLKLVLHNKSLRGRISLLFRYPYREHVAFFWYKITNFNHFV